MIVPEDFLYYLAMHRECTERLLARAKGFSSDQLEISRNPQALLLRKMVYAVQGEVHRMKAFVRLKPLGGQALWGYIKPRHKIGEHICRHFARRNPGLMVVLGNGSESWTAFYWQGMKMEDHSGSLTETLDRLRSALEISKESEAADHPDVNAIWQVYYDSQYCQDRKNLPAFRRRMPARDQKSAGLRLVQKKSDTTLEDFVSRV